MKRFNRSSHMIKIISHLMAFLLVTSLAYQAPGLQGIAYAKGKEAEETEAENQEYEVMYISSSEDLLALAERCDLDKSSRNLLVSLQEDIDLSGTTFEGIPIFAGIFEGNGHSIYGYQLEAEGYSDGFFRYLAVDGVIQNVTFQGFVKSEDVEEFAGGVVGINRGTIQNSMFIGYVNGQIGVGGICGENTSTGIIRGCKCSGVITGSNEVGGICGRNHGRIETSSNSASINASELWIENQDSDSLAWVKNLLETETSETRIVDVTDIGGVCGYSDGIIDGCINKGSVGYEHMGYNVGGICGRQAGLLQGSTNFGVILGRKDVGGIVGQMEPYIDIDESLSVRDDVDELHDMVNKLLDDLDAAEGAISSDFDDLQAHTDKAVDYGQNMADELFDFTNANIDSVNDAQSRLEYVLEHLPEIAQEVQNALDMGPVISSDLRKVTDDLDIVSQLQNTTYNEADHQRLSLVTGVGGRLSSNMSAPAEGDSVKVTSTAQNGYALSKVTVKDASGNDVKFTQSGNEIQFTMPSPNVVVSAEYKYVGEYVASSNEGGSLSVSGSGDTVTIEVLPDSGYTFSNVKCGNELYDKSEFTLNDNVYSKEVSAVRNGSPILVQTSFSQEATTYAVTMVATTGGSVTSDMQRASAGDTVTLTVHEYTGYKLSGIQISYDGGFLSATRKGSTNEYTFTMPASDASVLASFQYTPSSDTTLYVESTPGGTVVAAPVVGSNDYVITITPASGYEVSTTSALVIHPNSGADVTIPESDLSGEGPYTYRLNSNDYASPTGVKANFEKSTGAYTISCTDGTGGVITSSVSTQTSGEKVNFTAIPASGYRLKSGSLHVLCGGADVQYAAESADNTYSFTMPSGNVQIIGSFEPVLVIVESNPGGNASYRANAETVALTVSPNSGYSLSGNPVVKDVNGNNIPLSKKSAGSYTYEFKLNSQMEPARVQITFARSTDYQTVEDAKDNISTNSDLLTDTMNSMQDTVSQIEDLLTDENGEALSYEEIITDSEKTSELTKLLVDLIKELADAGEQSAEIISSLSTIVNVLSPYVEDAMKNARTDCQKALDDMDTLTMHLRNASEVLDQIVNYLNAQAELRFQTLTDTYKENMDNLFDELDLISDVMTRLGDDADRYTKTITNDMRAINDKVNDILGKLIDRVEGADSETIKEEVLGTELSDEEIALISTGKVSGCVNKGRVEGDRSVGGIAGSMSIDEEDPEGSAAGTVDWSVLNSYTSSMVLENCSNYGSILAKKENVACIVGYMAMGNLVSCYAYGEAECTEGGYVGGICGQSYGVIRDSYSLCALHGASSYVGGIAGYGYTIRNCKSMTLIFGDVKRTGEIAGQIHMDEDSEGVIDESRVCNNYYVSSTLCGVDSISYVDVAEPITYEEMLEIPGIPREFRNLKVNLKADDKLVDTLSVNFGEDLGNLVLPAVPQKDGYYGKWPSLEGITAEGVLTVDAEYFDNITTLQSEDGIRDESILGMTQGMTIDSAELDRIMTKPYVLMDGVFDDGITIHAEVMEDVLPENLVQGHDYTIYKVHVNGAGENGIEKSKIRLLHEYGDGCKVFVLRGDEWVVTESADYGNYVQTSFEGTQQIYAIVSSQMALSMEWIMIIIGAAVGALALIILIVLLRRRSKKRKIAKEIAEENAAIEAQSAHEEDKNRPEDAVDEFPGE